MKRMWWLPSFSILFILVVASTVLAQQPQRQAMAGAEGKAALTQMVDKGMKLFMDPKLGTTDMSCNSCHIEMGKAKKDGPMGAKPLAGRTRSFPKFVPMTKRVVTLDQMTQFCIVNPMKGTALPWDSEEITALVAYMQTLSGK